MLKKYITQNIEILVGSFMITGGIVLIPFVLSASIITILRGFTGWSTFFLLFTSLVAYLVTSSENMLLRLTTIGMLSVLTVGYFLYLVFGLEAYRFACSALIFDFGTALVAFNILVRLWQPVRTLIWKILNEKKSIQK